MTQKGGSRIIQPKEKLSLRQTQTLYKVTLEALKSMSIRCQMACCELHRVDENNDLLKMNEGVFDKEHLFEIRKALKDGSYDRNRAIAREAWNKANIKEI